MPPEPSWINNHSNTKYAKQRLNLVKLFGLTFVVKCNYEILNKISENIMNNLRI